MLDALRREILAMLRVPPEPRPPAGTPGSLLVFRAGRNFYRWQVLAWAVSHVGVVLGAVGGYYALRNVIARAPHWVHLIYQASEILGLVLVAVALPFTFLALKLNYELRWYIVTDRSLRIRRGVWNVEELTMTFANIQEIRVTSGPMQNWLGLADVEVHAAGGVTVGRHGETKGHLATFEGVDNANEIRDLMVERLRQYRDPGLNDAAPLVVANTLALDAARSVLEEARLLRSELSLGTERT